MFERRGQDRRGYGQIAAELDERHIPTARGAALWSGTAVSKILANPVYIGHVQWGEAYSEAGQHEPIIDAALWQRTQAHNAQQRATSSHAQTGDGLLLGMVRCGYCGAAMRYDAKTVGRRRAGLRCTRYMRTGGRECQSNRTIAEDVEAFVLDAVRAAMLADPDAAREASATTDDTTSEAATIRAALAELEKRWQRWNALYESGGITATELMLHRERIHGGIARHNVRLRALEDQSAASQLRADTWEQMRAVAGLLPTLARDDLRAVYHALIAQIRVKRGEPPVIDWL
jgi:site-specific DNA recombinase